MRAKIFLATILSLGFPWSRLRVARQEVIPEPETLMLLAIGAVAVAIVRWKNRK